MNYFRVLYELNRLRQNEKKTKMELHQLQDKKLRKLLKYAYDNSEYYRKSFEKAGIFARNLETVNLSELPEINKEILMEHFDEIVTKPDLTQEELHQFDEEQSNQEAKYKDKYHLVHSSGSTGVPRYFVYDEAAWEQMIVGVIRGALWNVSTGQFLKWLSGSPRILYVAATDGRYGGAMAVSESLKSLRVKQKSLDINTPLSEWIQTVQEFQPNFIIGYPSAIKILGELMADMEKPPIYRIISCGEPLNPGLRKFLEETFQTTVVNFYGASESLPLGVEAGAGQGMILFDDLNVIEVENGEMYLTCLYNFTQPLIRYHVSDRLVLHQGISEEIPYTRAEVLLCRDEDVLWFTREDGTKEILHPLSLEGFCMDGLMDYQFRQISEQSFEMLAEISDDTKEQIIGTKLMSQMQEILKNKNLLHVEFQIRFVHQIMPDATTGKKSLVVSTL